MNPDPRSLIARMTCKVCGGLEVVSHMVINAAGLPASQSVACPHCTNLDDEKDIMDIVEPLVKFSQKWLDTLGKYMRPESDQRLAQAFVNLAEYCALRGIEPSKPGHGEYSIEQIIHGITDDRMRTDMPGFWSGRAFASMEHLADQPNLDLAAAVEEVMKERTDD